MRNTLALGLLIALAGPAAAQVTDPTITQSLIAVTVCKSGWVDAMNKGVSSAFINEQKRNLAAEHRLDPDTETLVRRVPIALGGDTGRDNFMVEPKEQQLDPAAKARLTEAVRKDVCAHRLTLAQGQAIFLGDWRAEYRRRYK